MARTLVRSVILFALCALLAGCGARLPLRPADPQEVETFTAGLVSRHEPVRVTFTHALGQAGKELSASPVSFKPPLAGSARWTDERTLEFVPKTVLPAGRKYVASVNLPGASGFDFTFTVLAPWFDISLGPLTVESDEATSYRLDGTLTTMDTEDPARVEKLVSARLGRSGLPVEWEHGTDPLEHAFRITGITRAARPAELDISWSGAAIGSRASGKRQLAVPASGAFQVMAVRPVEGDQKFIEVSFSESLKTPQDLDGLLRVQGRDDLRTAVDSNIVRLYALSPWKQSETVTVQPGVQSFDQGSLVQLVALNVSFTDQLPQVRFTGAGAIVPTSQGTTVPIETMNLRAVIVEAFQVYGDNMTQFLQVNSLDGKREMYRVGKVVWRDVIQLGFTDDQKNTWIRHGLDLSPLIKDHPDGLFQVRVSFRPPHIVWPVAAPVPENPVDFKSLPLMQDDPRGTQPSYWDYYDEAYTTDDYYSSRNDPTSPAYYANWYSSSNRNVLAVRNVLVSNLGLVAKAEPGGDLHVFATDLRTAQFLPGVKVTLQSFQRRVIAAAQTDGKGMATFSGIESPDFVIGERAGQFAWLKLDPASALVTSHLDTAGQAVQNGVKGFLYGERGVWRPGDQIFLTFILSDPEKSLPAGHPVTLEMRDPRGQLASRTTANDSVDGFYPFATSTPADAPTGTWEARIKVGDRVFSRPVKVESIMPNRIRIGFDVPGKPGALTAGPFTGSIQADWLYGAPAANLKADLSIRLAPTQTVFPKYEDYIFDDPTRQFSVPDQTLFEGALDARGAAQVSSTIDVQGEAPGKLAATFQARVFEQGGAFSSEQFTRELSPYDSYVGIRVPRGDAVRGMLLVDTDQSVRIVMVDGAGNPVKSGKVQASIYKIQWRWWWEKGGEDLADFATSDSTRPIQSDTVNIANGAGEWKFRIKYPDWGRYLIRVVDNLGEHSAGKVVYIDWPGWAGRSVEGKIGASMLTLAVDKPGYKVGEQVSVTFPSNPQGRALVSLEAGGKIIRKEWVTGTADLTRYRFTATPDMAPNIYVHVTFVQPHLQTANDLPIRLYGIVPVMVEDPATHLVPVIQSADTFRPAQQASVSVKESAGREMTYTLALVDEGLLRINRYATPDPWTTFYQREASLLHTWDLYDMVAGAFSGKLDSLLAVGGGDDLFGQGERKANRFPPIVKFIGPVSLAKGAVNTHAIDIPQYVGAVRIMVVAGHAGAYGTAESSVTVKSDLMVLPTLPRVLGIGETVQFPVTVMNTRADVTSVSVTVTASGPVTVGGAAGPVAAGGSATQTVRFPAVGEQIARFTLNVGATAGLAKVSVSATGGNARAAQDTEIDVRVPATRQTQVATATITAGRTWQEDETLGGYAGTSGMTLELSRIPPMDLGRNLEYLVQYPHGCIEQTTSSIFPQLSLGDLVKLSPAKAAQVQRNIEAGITRLGWFQTSSGGFSFWPGEGVADEWGSTYAGHFLLEARKRGFALPPDMLAHWSEYQRLAADAWTPDNTSVASLQQAYRLYTLALSGDPDLGAMNSLRELPNLAAAVRWRLAAAYQVAGQAGEAQRMVGGLDMNVPRYRQMAGTYGSDLRDKAMILESLVLLGMNDKADSLAVAVSDQLASTEPYATQTTAYALLALSQYAIGEAGGPPVSFSYSWAGAPAKAVSDSRVIVQEDVAVGRSSRGRLLITNTGTGTLYARIIMSGVPTLGTEKADANGLDLKVAYTDSNGVTVDPGAVAPGSDLTATVRVTNTSRAADYQQLALSFLLPGSWEVATARVLPDTDTRARNYDYQDIRDDRILTYFDLKRGAAAVFVFQLTAAYSGRFYMPSIKVEAMYDSTIHAVVPGAWLGGR